MSVPANIAGGAARKSFKEFPHFLSNAQGSASGVETGLPVASRLGFLGEKEYARLHAALDEIGRMLMGLSHHLSRELE